MKQFTMAEKHEIYKLAKEYLIDDAIVGNFSAGMCEYIKEAVRSLHTQKRTLIKEMGDKSTFNFIDKYFPEIKDIMPKNSNKLRYWWILNSSGSKMREWMFDHIIWKTKPLIK